MLSPIEIDRVIQMAWEDRTPFEAIKFQFDLSEKSDSLDEKRNDRKNWRKWRKRVQGRKTKHLKLREEGVNRFKCSRQRNISGNRISKR